MATGSTICRSVTTGKLTIPSPEEYAEIFGWDREPESDQGCTIAELAEQFNQSKSAMRRKVNRLIEMGKCAVGKAAREDVTGRRQRVPVYRPITSEATIPT